jgi:hypothetical protein
LIKYDELPQKLSTDVQKLMDQITVVNGPSKFDLNTIIERYNSNIVSLLEDARNKHKSLGISNVPWWAWALMLYLGYDDIYRLVTSWLLFPLIFLGVILFLLKTNPILRPLNTMLSLAFDSIFSNVKQKIL